MNAEQKFDRETMRFMNRKNPLARFILILVVATIIGALAAYIFIPKAEAHPGGRDSIGCHTDKSTGSLHWHQKGVSEPMGPCDETEKGRVRVKMVTEFVEVPVADVAMKQQLLAAETKIQGLTDSLMESRRAQQVLNDSLNVEMTRSAEARANARAAEMKAVKAELRMATMKDEVGAARRGEQPCVPQRERLAARVDERWASGWRDDAMALVECLRDD